MALIKEGWEDEGLDDVTWLSGAVYKDDCCNWLNKFTAFVSTDQTIPSAWGPGFNLAISTLVLGASGNIFCRIPD